MYTLLSMLFLHVHVRHLHAKLWIPFLLPARQAEGAALLFLSTEMPIKKCIYDLWL